MEEIEECLEITKATSKKVEEVISQYHKKEQECRSKNLVIKWLIIALMTFIVATNIVAVVFVYGYFNSYYNYAEVQQETNLPDGSIVNQSIK